MDLYGTKHGMCEEGRTYMNRMLLAIRLPNIYVCRVYSMLARFGEWKGMAGSVSSVSLLMVLTAVQHRTPGLRAVCVECFCA